MEELVRAKSQAVRALRVLMAVYMAAIFLVGCGSTPNINSAATKTAASTPPARPASWISDDPISFTMLYADNPTYPFNKDWPVLQEVTKRTNVTLNCQIVPQADMDTKIKLVLSSGDAPDIIAFADLGKYTDFALNGSLVPVSDYMDKLPNYNALIQKWELADALRNYKLSDGKIYTLAGAQENPVYTAGLVMRADLLKKYHMDIPKTFDDLYNYASKLKQDFPDSVPVTEEYGIDCMLLFAGPSWGLDAGWGLQNDMTYNRDTKKFEFAYTSDKYKAMLTYWAKLSKEKMLDPELFTQNRDQWKQKLVTGKSFITWCWSPEVAELNIDLKKNVGSDAEFQFFLPVGGPAGRFTAPGGKIAGGTGIQLPAADTNKPYFDQLLKFLDWFCYSEEGQTLTTWGVEGQSYNIVDGKKAFSDAVKGDIDNLLMKNYGTENNNFDYGFSTEFSLARLPQDIAAVCKQAIDGNMIPSPTPIVKLTSDESEQVKLLATPLKDFGDQTQAKFILGQLSLDTDWDSFVSQAKTKGSDKLVDIMNQAWAKQNGN